MAFFETQNPFWAWSLQVIGYVLLLTLILYLSANNFDNTELEVIGWFAGSVVLGKAPNLVKKVLSKGGE